MAIVARRFIMIALIFAIFAMLLAWAVANNNRETWVTAVTFCAPNEGPTCLLSNR